jgi:hypothetical protein
VSRLCDRVTRRASPGPDTDLSGLGLGFIYPGNVRFSCSTLPISSILFPCLHEGKTIGFATLAASLFPRTKELGARPCCLPREYRWPIMLTCSAAKNAAAPSPSPFKR